MSIRRVVVSCVLLVACSAVGGVAAAKDIWLGEYEDVPTGKFEKVWIGTAPSCSASRADCTKKGWEYVKRDGKGDGSSCWSGYKVQCKKPVTTRKKKMVHLDDAFTYRWFGEAPFCSTSAKDCTDRSMTYVMSHDAGDGKACTSGKKVLCKIRKDDPAYFYRWIGTAPSCGGKAKDCTEREMELVMRDSKGDGSGCVSGWKVRCRIKRPPAQRPIPAAKRGSLRVLAYNIYMRPSLYMKNGQVNRAVLMPKYLADYDVIVFSEAFDEVGFGLLWAGLQGKGFKHRSRVLGAINPLKGNMWDGGVIIVSKHPFEKMGQKFQRERKFGSACAGGDCSADKGVLYVRVKKDGKRYHIFGSHTQAWADAKGRSTRVKQFEIMDQFISDSRIPMNEPVIIAGDLNADKTCRASASKRATECFNDPVHGFVSKEYKDMLNQLKAEEPRAVGHKYTADPSINELNTQGTTREYLDFVLYSVRHQKPKASASYSEVRTMKSSTKWKEFAWETKFDDLSDHFAQFGYLEY